MLSEEIIMFGVPLVTFIITATIAYLFGISRSRVALAGLGVIWAGFTGLMFFGMENATGWDGLGYAIALVGLGAPAGAGLGLGGLIGWLKSGKMIHA